MNDKPLPYITAALLCESVIEEKNGTLSIVRIADRMEYQVTGMPEGYVPVLQFQGLLALKSGPAKGNFKVEIKTARPTGKVSPEVISIPVQLNGGDHGFNVKLSFVLTVHEEGLHWFDVYFDGELLTRIPFTVVRKSEPEQKTN